MKGLTNEYSSRQFMLSSDYEIFHYSTTDIHDVRLHHHDFYEFYLFISGNVTYLIEGKIYSMKPGDIVLVNSKELHQAVINNRDAVYERIVLWISRSFLEKLCSSKTDLSLCFEDPDKKNVLRTDFVTQKNIRLILNRIINLQAYKGIGHELLSAAYITELMVNINNIVYMGDLTLSVDVKKNTLIDRIIDYINNRLEDTITVDELGEFFHFSKFHLSREFKRQTGTTIHRYILQKRLILSKELILQNMPVMDVYKQSGFGDYSNFFKAFKKEYGVTPKQFYDLMCK